MNNAKSNVGRKSAGVFQHPEFLILHAFQRLGDGPELATIPVVRLPASTSIAEIGLTLRQMLTAYQVNTSTLFDWKAARAQFLQATGFRSWRALEGPAKMCWIEEIGDRIIFTPLRNGGTRGPKKGFQPFGAAEISVPARATDVELGKALLSALSQAQ